MKRVAMLVLSGWLLTCPPGAGADSDWFLLVPPVDSDKLNETVRWTGGGLGSPVAAATEALRGSYLKTAAPLREWERLGSYGSAAECEEWRIRYQGKADRDIQAFQRSLGQPGASGVVSPEEMVKLVFYSQANESRCVGPPPTAPGGGSQTR